MMRTRCEKAFTLAEALVATVLVAVVIVTAMNAAGSVRKTEISAAKRAFGVRLAEELVEEIDRTSYMEPRAASDAISLEAGEDQALRRTLDDVDDYHGLREDPLTDIDGHAIAKASGWSRQVEVMWTRADDPMGDSGISLGRKRITVRVQYGPAVVAQLVAFRARNVPARKEY
jgi:hypothetical protein